MHGDVPLLQAKIQFAFYLVALLIFLVATVLPPDTRWLRRINLVPLGLATALAPSAYIYFKAAFHPGSYFH